MLKIRTTNWNNFNKFVQSKAPVHLEPYVRKAEIARRYSKKLRTESKNVASIMGCTHAGKTYRLVLESHAHLLFQLAHALSTSNRDAIRRAVNARINFRYLELSGAADKTITL